MKVDREILTHSPILVVSVPSITGLLMKVGAPAGLVRTNMVSVPSITGLLMKGLGRSNWSADRKRVSVPSITGLLMKASEGARLPGPALRRFSPLYNGALNEG